MAKFTVVLEGNFPEDWSGNQLSAELSRMTEEVNSQGQGNGYHLEVVDLKTEGPGLTNLPEKKSEKLKFKDYDNTRYSWQ